MIPKHLTDEMRELINIAREKNLIVPAEEAFKSIPPEGIWSNDENGNIILGEI